MWVGTWVEEGRIDARIRKADGGDRQDISKVGRYADGGGLYLQISQFGTKAWLLRYMLNGRAREMGLRIDHDFSLKEARDRARLFRQQLADGIDPIEARRGRRMAERAETAARITFKDAAANYIESQKAGWKNAKHAAQWESTLATYAYPLIGDLCVAEIETAHVSRNLRADLDREAGNGFPPAWARGSNPRVGNRAGASKR